VALLVGTLAACADEPATDDTPLGPSPRECAALRDRMIEVRLQGVTVDRAQHQAALETSLGASFLTACATTLNRAQVECGRTAEDAAALAACAAL
jgi:hypothetical protein